MNQFSENSNKIFAELYEVEPSTSTANTNATALFKKVAKHVALAELNWADIEVAQYWEKQFFTMMNEWLFLPNSPTLMNAGNEPAQLSACFVLPIENNEQQIANTQQTASRIQRTGGGTGFNFSNLYNKNNEGTNFCNTLLCLQLLNNSTENNKALCKRRGANMGVLNINHPDIEQFITAKLNNQALNNFNLSVGISHAFMQAVEQDKDWHLIHPATQEIVQTIGAKQLWNLIVETAWHTGEPGLLFLDTINEKNPTPNLGKINCTNPCGEVPLMENEACNLGSINVSRMIKKNNGGVEIDWRKLEAVTTTAIRFLDNVIEINQYPNALIKTTSLSNRKIGLGIMGWAELLILLELPYESDKAIGLAEKLMQFIQEQSFDASVQLSKQRGVFANWNKSIYYPHQPIRNATRTSIAPTGTISILANTSSSIEPLFALAYQKQQVLQHENVHFISSLFINYLKKYGLYSEINLQSILKKGKIDESDHLPIAVKNLFKTALQIQPSIHLLHLLAFQKYTDNAVSKTINMAEDVSMHDISLIFKNAWLQHAKGITVFRNHCKGKQVLIEGV